MPVNPKSKITERQHYQQIEKSTGKPHPKLKPVPLPDTLAYVWTWYNDVKTQEPLTCAEILAWNTLTGNELTRFEFDLIRMLDVVFWKIHNDRNREANSGG